MLDRSKNIVRKIGVKTKKSAKKSGRKMGSKGYADR
jgi:hypothetical protein